MTKKLLFIALAAMAAWSPLKGMAGEPTSEIREIFFRIGGGMNPYDEAYVQLTRAKDGTLTLTLKGDCPQEKLSFEVEDSVMERCKQIIREHKLWKAEGYYKPKYQLLDAPSAGFHVSYKSYGESFNASGDIPNSIWDGINAITKYLNSLRGDRQAEGHFNRLWSSKVKLDGNTEWSNGKISFTPEEKGIDELLEYLSKEMNEAYDKSDWDYNMAEGNGIRALILTNRHLSYMDVFSDKKSPNRTITYKETPQGKWPQGSTKLLTRQFLSTLSKDDLRLLENEILARHGITFKDKEMQEYFNAQPWYKASDDYGLWEVTDIEDQNMRMLEMFEARSRR